jgi:DNA-binding PadR family transcriptional regulator
MQNIQGDAVRGHLDELVLAVLEAGPAHGLEVVRRLRAAGRGALALKEGSVYPALYRLEESGQLAAAWEPEPRRGRGPRKRIYRLTSKGRRRLAAGRRAWRRFVSVVGGVLGAPA